MLWFPLLLAFFCSLTQISAVGKAEKRNSQNIQCPQGRFCFLSAVNMLGTSFDVNTIDDSFGPSGPLVLAFGSSPLREVSSSYWSESFPIPQYVFFQDSPAPDTFTNGEIITSSADLRQFVSQSYISAELNGEKNFGSFSGHTDFGFLSDSTSKSSYARVVYHTLSITSDERNSSWFSPNFIDNIKSLPVLESPSEATELEKERYQNFIETYGTHMISHIQMGLEFRVDSFDRTCKGEFASDLSVEVDGVVSEFRNGVSFSLSRNFSISNSEWSMRCLVKGGDETLCCVGEEYKCFSEEYIASARHDNLLPLKIYGIRIGNMVDLAGFPEQARGVRYFIKLYMDSFPETNENENCKEIQKMVSGRFEIATIVLGVFVGLFCVAGIAAGIYWNKDKCAPKKK